MLALKLVDWSGRHVDSCGRSVSRGDPAGAKRRGGSTTARGKRSAWSGNQQLILIHPIFSKSLSSTRKIFAFFGKNRKDFKTKRMMKMRFGDKGLDIQKGENKLFGVDFHDFLQKEQSSNMVELASEFGLSVRDIRKLKKHLERS
jgi:hypothetical protein